MAVFKVSGKMTLGSEERPFTKEVEAETESAARHRAYAILGSNNGVTRNKVKIEKVEKAK
jgi:ribosomal protein L20A (L18A)